MPKAIRHTYVNPNGTKSNIERTKSWFVGYCEVGFHTCITILSRLFYIVYLYQRATTYEKFQRIGHQALLYYTYRPKKEPYFCKILRNYPLRSKNIFTVYFHGLSPLVTRFVDYLNQGPRHGHACVGQVGRLPYQNFWHVLATPMQGQIFFPNT